MPDMAEFHRLVTAACVSAIVNAIFSSGMLVINGPPSTMYPPEVHRLIDQGDYDGAIAAIREAINIDPKHPSYYHALGSLWLD